MVSELAKRMIEHGVVSPFDLTEFDQWVNDATRKDIENVARKHDFKVFGLKFWSWKKKRGRELIGARNFEVDLIFRDEDEPKVDALIKKYKKREINEMKVVNELFDLAVMDCLWV